MAKFLRKKFLLKKIPKSRFSFQLLSVGREKSIRKWNLPSGTEAFALEDAHKDYLTRILALGNSHALSCSFEPITKLWNLKTKTTLTNFVGHFAPVLCVSLIDGTKKDRIFATGSTDSSINLYRLWEEGNVMDENLDEETEGETDEDGDDKNKNTYDNQNYNFVSTSSDQTKTKTQQPIQRFDSHQGGVLDILSISSDVLVSSSSDTDIKIWSIEKSKEISSITKHLSPVRRLDWSPKTNLLYSGGREGEIYVFDLRIGNRSKTSCDILSTNRILTDSWITAIRRNTMTSNDTEFFCGNSSGNIFCFDIRKTSPNEYIWKQQVHRNGWVLRIQNLQTTNEKNKSKSSNFLTTCSSNGEIKMQQLKSKKKKKMLSQKCLIRDQYFSINDISFTGKVENVGERMIVWKMDQKERTSFLMDLLEEECNINNRGLKRVCKFVDGSIVYFFRDL